MTDLELQLALAKLMPEVLGIETAGSDTFVSWRDSGDVVREKEWLHVCWLVRVKYVLPLAVGCNEPWQDQAKHIIDYMKPLPLAGEGK